MNLVAKLGTILRLPLNSERLRKLTENYVVSNQKIINSSILNAFGFIERIFFPKTLLFRLYK
jgi:hypothetical protein